ncbi:P-loop containing nucleoside triphosphate hydrolase protein [Neoconidiobolus thromboides FSU 785]|nr:P-loop containing nucleoside triphosphate hydrolase protein [Neoconidiobolus thromboides FSU 785]
MTDKKKAKLSKNHQSNQKPSATLSKTSQTSIHTTPSDIIDNHFHVKRNYLPGSIKRVKLENFVTYDFCEFTPGPNMNMVIGPNGTGKSTIVCAIALGLGGVPSVLGRAKDISEFVKHGYEHASIEIELQNKKDINQPLIIKRLIQKGTNSTSWELNGETARLRDITKKIKEFNIQVDNLCQFLPQDKVAEFAQLQKMSPYDLLLATQKAAGESQMHEWHQRLIEHDKEMKSHNSNLQADLDKMKSLELRLESSKIEAERFKERDSNLKKIKLYKTKMVFLNYEELKEQFNVIRIKREKIKNKYDKINNAIEPLLVIKKEESDKLTILEDEAYTLMDKRKSQFHKFDKMMTNMTTKPESLKTTIARINTLKKSERDHGATVRTKEIELNQLKEIISNDPPPVTDFSEIDAKIDESSRESEVTQDRMSLIRVEQEKMNTETHGLNVNLKRLDAKLKELEDVKLQRKEKLRAFNQDAVRAMDWLKHNRTLFKYNVFDPISLEIEVKDKRYAQAVENCINANALKTFVCQSAEDYKLCSSEMIDKNKFRVNIICIDQTIEDFKHPFPVEKIREFGFEDYALNLVEGPKPVLAALCKMCNFHGTPISLKSVDNEKVERSRRISKYVAGQTLYTITVADYGDRNVSSLTQRLKVPRFVGVGVDPTVKKKMIDDQYAIRKELEKFEKSQKGLNEKLDSLKRVLIRQREAKEELMKKRADIKNENLKYARRRALYEKNERDLVSLKEKNYQDQINKAQERKSKLEKEYLRDCKELKEAVVTLRKINELVVKKKLEIEEMKSKIQYIENSLMVIEDFRMKEKYNLMGINEEFNNKKKEAHQELAKAKAALSVMPEEDKTQLKELCSAKSLDQLNDELLDLEAAVNATTNADSKAFETFKLREKELEVLKARIADKESGKEKLEEEINEIRETWIPKIEELVAKISEKFSIAFENIGCSGEVALKKGEEYDKWGIDIMVKFRANEKLQALTGFRQSGGEKSVSTIMFLMAIQELAKSPFRVVDEINQGMDPRNERLIHKQLIETACKPNTAQYFLITPKLLPNLVYHQNMKVLCIYNGEWQPKRFLMTNYLSSLRRENGPLKRAIAGTQD